MFQYWKMRISAKATKRLVSKFSESLVLNRQFCSTRLLCDTYDESRITSKNVKNLLENSQVEETPDPKTFDSAWLTSPYKRKEGYPRRPAGDPTDYSIILFPGQGTQYVGMGKAAFQQPSVKELFEVASDILGWDLAKLCFEGPKHELDKTSKAQPAILVSSLAALELMREKEPSRLQKCMATAGFSVGEFAALVFAGAVSFEDAVHLVKVRGEAMQAASELVPSGMMTVILDSNSQIGVACHEAVRWCTDKGIEKPVCTTANYLYPHCKVIAGHKEALDFVRTNAKSYHLKRCMSLPVSGAFHTKLMKPAVEAFQKEVYKIDFQRPVIPVHSNIDGNRYRSGYQVGQLLCKQIISPVKWEQTMHVLTDYSKESKLPNIYECGPGKSLSTLLRMVNFKAVCHNYQV